MLSELGSESRPHLAQILQVDEKDGNAKVGYNPDKSQKSDPEVIDPPSSSSSAAVERHVLPDDIIGPRCESDCGTDRLLLTTSVGDTMSLCDIRVTREAIRHRASLVYRGAYFFDLNLEITNSLGVIFYSIDLLASGISSIRSVLLRGLAHGPSSWDVLGVLEVLSQDLLKFANSVVVLLDKLREFLDISGNSGSSKR